MTDTAPMVRSVLRFGGLKRRDGEPLDIPVRELTLERALSLARDPGVRYRHHGDGTQVLLMAWRDTAMGSALHSHTVARGDASAMSRGAEELVTRLWRAYGPAAEVADELESTA